MARQRRETKSQTQEHALPTEITILPATVAAKDAVLTVPRHALLALALVLHDICQTQEISHAQAA